MRKQSVLLPPFSHRVLRAYGFATVAERWFPGATIHSARIGRLRFPAVLKRISPALIHKTDQHAVWSHLATAAALRTALRDGQRRFPQRSSDDACAGWLVQRHVPGRTELFVGAHRDPTFGPVLAVGIGGVDVELLQAIILLLPPFAPRSIADSIAAAPLARWLTRRRGHQPVDIVSLATTIARLGQLLQDFPVIDSVDINPLLVEGDQPPLIIDARIAQALP